MSAKGEFNRARVFEIIRLFEPISRTEIASRLDLTSAAISNIVGDLLSRGFITQLGRRNTSRGQPSIELGVQADSAYTVGLHFDHSSVDGVVADLKGKELNRLSIKLNPLPSPEAVLDALVSVGTELINQVEFEKLIGAGLASVGPLDLASGSVMRTDYTSNWGEVSLRDPLAEAFGLPVTMDNNATAGAIGELWYGIGRRYKNFLYIGFNSMGLGGGLVLNNRLYRGSSLNAAEFGHMIMGVKSPEAGAPPFLEKFVSGHALCRDLGDSILQSFDERLATADVELEQWLDRASEVFAQAVVSVDHLLDLDTIIVGGELPSGFFEELLIRVEQSIAPLYMHGWGKRATLQMGQVGLSSAVRGAAVLPIYDAFSPASPLANDSLNLLRSSAAGGPMH